MAKVKAISTTYWPNVDGLLIRYEDWYGDERDVYEVPDADSEAMVASGHFSPP